MTDVPESFKVCGHKRYRPDAALWTYRRTNRLAQVSWGHGRKLIEPAVLSFEQKAADEMPLIENKVSALIRKARKMKPKLILPVIPSILSIRLCVVGRKWKDSYGISLDGVSD